MPTIPPLPQALIPVLPFVTLVITDWLRHSTLPRWINVLIGLFVPLFLATIWALLSNALTPDLNADIVLLVALCYAVMALPDIAPLRDWLQSTLVSPAAVFVSHSQPQPAIRRASLQDPDLRYVASVPRYHTTLPSVLPGQPMQAVTPPPEAEPAEEEAAPTEQS